MDRRKHHTVKYVYDQMINAIRWHALNWMHIRASFTSARRPFRRKEIVFYWKFVERTDANTLNKKKNEAISINQFFFEAWVCVSAQAQAQKGMNQVQKNTVIDLLIFKYIYFEQKKTKRSNLRDVSASSCNTVFQVLHADPVLHWKCPCYCMASEHNNAYYDRSYQHSAGMRMPAKESATTVTSVHTYMRSDFGWR